MLLLCLRSVYAQGFPYFGNGLMYAMTPWSGYYEAGNMGADGASSNGAAIWTNAHTCQFIQVEYANSDFVHCQ